MKKTKLLLLSIMKFNFICLAFIVPSYCLAQNIDDEEHVDYDRTMACTLNPPVYFQNPQFFNPVKYANELYQTLSSLKYRTCSDAALTINIKSGYDIFLGDLPAYVFPLEIPKGVTLQGDFDLGSVTDEGKSAGTRIFFPWMYEYGVENTVIDMTSVSAHCNNDYGAAFKMLDKSKISNICLVGPTTDIKDWRYGDSPGHAYFDWCSDPKKFKPLEGMNSGIYVFGNNCEISYCEIYGFRHNGVQVRDMVENYGTSKFTAADCYDQQIDSAGRFYFHHNYVHNCKGYGFGYGLWVSAGSTDACSPNNATNSCSSANFPLAGFFNSLAPEEIAHIHDNVFFENKHDIASSGNRTSLDIRQNTFSQRSQDWNINMHNEETYVCNPMSGIYNATGFITKPVLENIGGSQVIIEENTFYRGGVIDLKYPNLNECNNSSAYPNYPFSFPKIEINGNYFKTAAHIIPAYGNQLDWLQSNGIPTGYDKIRIGDYYHYQYKYKSLTPVSDDHIQIGENGISSYNYCNELPFPILSKTPVAKIASVTNNDKLNGATSDATDKFIKVGETIWFDTHLCEDKTRNTPPLNDLLNIWRFHTSTSDLDDEIRTDNSNAQNPFSFTFNKVGINNVTLMTLDKTTSGLNEWRASDLARQLITVAPKDQSEYLTFWIKDTYVGRELIPYSNPNNNLQHGVDDGRNPPPTQSPTGFVKYAKVNGNIVWTDDIEGDEGWQYVKVFLGHGQPGSPYYSGTLEIGIMSVSDVDAIRVRGVTFYVDDVYISCNDGSNAITNGDFERRITQNNYHLPTLDHAVGWTEFKETSNPALNPLFGGGCFGGSFYYPAEDMRVVADEVRSGSLAYKGWIRNVSYNQSSKGLYYKSPYIYKSIKQNFDLSLCADNNAIVINDFEIYPNPLENNRSLTITCDGIIGDEKMIEIKNTQGANVFHDTFKNNMHTINCLLKPGVYTIVLTMKDYNSVKKFIVTK